MTTDESLARLRSVLGLSHDQAMRLFPALTSLVAEALESDGVCRLGSLGEVRLDVWPRRKRADGSVRPEVPTAYLKPSQTLRKRVQQIPVMAAWMACRARGFEPDGEREGRVAG